VPELPLAGLHPIPQRLQRGLAEGVGLREHHAFLLASVMLQRCYQHLQLGQKVAPAFYSLPSSFSQS